MKNSLTSSLVASLAALNSSYHYHHTVGVADVTKVLEAIRAIENVPGRRFITERKPESGDVVEYTNKYGNFYKNAHLEGRREEHGGGWTVCERPYTPWVSLHDSGTVSMCASGGAWHEVDPSRMEYVGTTEKTFCRWGSVGPCAGGAIDFPAVVNVWRLVEEPAK